MLQTLRVRNLAIVGDVRVEFGPGLNVITGETGAGKSILVGALGLVLGERADKRMIRAGENRCTVEAALRLPPRAPVHALLDELGIDACEDGLLLVRRIVAASGSGKTLVNDCPATAQALRRIGDLLVDMHGPHDHQSLLNPDFQTDILDASGGLEKTRAAYEGAYREMLGLEAELRGLDCDEETVARQIELLSFQVKEIEDAGLSPDEEDELDREHRILANAQRILELADAIRNALTEDESAAYNALTAARRQTDALARVLPDADAWRKDAETAMIQVQELSDTINRAVQDIEADPGRLEWVEERLALLHGLKRKYAGSVADILAILEEKSSELHELKTRNERIAEIEAALGRAKKKVRSAGKKLSAERQAAAATLARAITKQLNVLGFAHGAFDVAVRPGDPGPSGLDTVEFGFAPNLGEPMRALRAIASSGEISRVMLAVKAVLAKHDRIPVLVFDEIDVNVGGEMGHAVGDKLAAVAGSHQVLCITHLPQVAVHGRTHFVVTKEVKDKRTFSQIRLVEKDDRAAEVARMLGDAGAKGVALAHAKEMLSAAKRG